MSFFHRVTRPPGGMTSIFMSDSAEDEAREARDSLSPQRKYRMASNFELGDEQPTQEEIERNQPNRRRSKPSGTVQMT